MNRKRDLEKLSLLYESNQLYGQVPYYYEPNKKTTSRDRIKATPGKDYFKNLTTERLLRTKLFKLAGESDEGTVLQFTGKSSKFPSQVVIDDSGKVNGENARDFIIRLKRKNVMRSEDEQTSAFGQELADEAEDQNPVQNYEDEEVQYQVGDKVKVNTQRSLDDLRSGKYGTGDLSMHGVISYIDDDNVQIDTNHGTMEVGIDQITRDEDAEDLGPNQQPESWGDEAMGSEEPGETSQRFAQDTPDDPASGGSPHIDDPDEQEEDDMDLQKALDVIRKHLKARIHGDESHANKEVRDAKKAYIKDLVKKRNKDEDEQGGKAIPTDLTYFDSDETDDDDPGKPGIRLFNPKTGHTKKESYNSHGDRDMTLLAENYLNIKHHE